MRFSLLLSGAFAALALAFPTLERRAALNASAVNNLAFRSQGLAYLNVVNALDVNLLQQLALQNNLNLLSLGGLFNSQAFDLNSVLQVQQLQTLLQLSQLGVLNNVDLATLQLQQLKLGLISNVGVFDLNSLVDVSLAARIQAIAAQQIIVI